MSWESVKLSDVCEIIAGQSPESTYYNKDGNGKPFFQGKADFGDDYPTVRYYTTKTTKSAQLNDILLSVRAPVGPTNICNIDACIGRGLAAIRAKESVFYKYVYYHFKSIEKKLSESGNGSTFSAITTNDIKEIPIPLPPISTQKRIAEILDKADALRKKDQQLLNQYNELAQSIFIEMFGDPVKNEKGWEVKKLEEFAKKEKNAIVDGPFGASVKDDDYAEDGIPVIRINNIREEGFYNGAYRLIKEEKYKELIRSKVDFNDILIARVGHTIGKSCIFNQKFKAMLSTTGVCKVSIDENICSLNFISFQLTMPTFKGYIKNQVQGAGQPYLNLTMIKGFKLISPPTELQTQFAQQIKNIEAQKEKVKTQMEASENLFQALLQKAFNGELIQ